MMEHPKYEAYLKGTPFVVYAADTPSFSGVLAPCKSWHQFPGSNVVISGGYYDPSGDGSAVISGLLDLPLMLGEIVSERVVAGLVLPDEMCLIETDLTFLLPEQAAAWLASARSLGFEVIQANDEHDTRAVVCIGLGRLLPELHWLPDEYVDGYSESPPMVIAFQDGGNPFVSGLLAVAQDKAGVIKTVRALESGALFDPEPTLARLTESRCTLLALLAGADGDCLLVNRPDADVSLLEAVLARAASDLAVPLFSAGRLSALGCAEALLDGICYDRVPDEWRQVG